MVDFNGSAEVTMANPSLMTDLMEVTTDRRGRDHDDNDTSGGVPLPVDWGGSSTHTESYVSSSSTVATNNMCVEAHV